MRAPALNYLLYQVGWFACVLGAAWGHPTLGTVLGLATVAVHVALARRRADELLLVLWAAAIGLVVDGTQIALGTLRFDVGIVASWLPPPWLTVVWMQFATTFHYSLRWLRDDPIRAAVFGAIGGPLAFWAGERLGVVTLDSERWPSLLVLAALWSVAMPLALRPAVRQRAHAGIGEYRLPGR